MKRFSRYQIFRILQAQALAEKDSMLSYQDFLEDDVETILSEFPNSSKLEKDIFKAVSILKEDFNYLESLPIHTEEDMKEMQSVIEEIQDKLPTFLDKYIATY